MRRGILACLIILAAAACAGCAPAVDADAAQRWLARAQAEYQGHAGLAGVISGMTDAPLPPGAAGIGGTSLSFDDPQPVGSVVVSCFGGQEIGVNVLAHSSTTWVRGDGVVPCDEQPHAIAVDAPEATEVTIAAVARPSTTTFVAGIMTAP